jgi:hypothetical protein
MMRQRRIIRQYRWLLPQPIILGFELSPVKPVIGEFLPKLINELSLFFAVSPEPFNLQGFGSNSAGLSIPTPQKHGGDDTDR